MHRARKSMTEGERKRWRFSKGSTFPFQGKILQQTKVNVCVTIVTAITMGQTNVSLVFH